MNRKKNYGFDDPKEALVFFVNYERALLKRRAELSEADRIKDEISRELCFVRAEIAFARKKKIALFWEIKKKDPFFQGVKTAIEGGIPKLYFDI